MDVSGIIFAVIDTPPTNVAAWNRWYDLEHLPPNVALDGIMSGRRYAAPPALQAARRPRPPMVGFADGQGMFLTIYTLCGDPVSVIGEMTTYRDRLVAEGRMDGAGDRTVRMGDAMTLTSAVGAPELRAEPGEVLFLAHSGVRTVLRRGDGVDTEAAVATAGVHGVASFRSALVDGVHCDLYLLEGDPIALTERCRGAAPYPDTTEVLVDAPWEAIVPFDYADLATAFDA